jgi:hypothetical protein
MLLPVVTNEAWLADKPDIPMLSKLMVQTLILNAYKGVVETPAAA